MAREIDNNFYNDLEDRWYSSSDHPVALLRAENRARLPWIKEKLKAFAGNNKCSILDIGCGAGFLTNELAPLGHDITGVDLSETSLQIAQEKDSTKRVKYLPANAYDLPFKEKSFDIIFAMDFLEHVDRPQDIVNTVAKLLRPKGLFFFHTFNRNFISYLLVIKGVEWFVKNTPKDMHLYNLFIKPEELTAMMRKVDLITQEIKGVSPSIKSAAFWKMVVTRKVPEELEFRIHNSLTTGYLGIASLS